MALESHQDSLTRAVRAARQEEPTGWIDVSESIMSRVRSMVTPAQPILAFTPAGQTDRDAAQSTTYVSARIVTAALRRRLQRTTHAPAAIDLTVEADRLVALRIELVCAYGVDLHAVADRGRLDLLDELQLLLGEDATFTPANIEIAITDVVAGDPNLV